MRCLPIAPCKVSHLDFTLWVPDSRYGFQFLSVELGFLIPDSMSCILDSKAQESGFHKQDFLGSPVCLSKNFPYSGIRIDPYLGPFPIG